MNLGRGLVVLGSAILLLLAALHALSYGTDSGEVAKSNLPSNLAEGFRGLYLAFSAQLVILSILFVLLAWKPGGEGASLAGEHDPVGRIPRDRAFHGLVLGNRTACGGDRMPARWRATPALISGSARVVKRNRRE
jgi:hypothetical protein